jgi:hypothetical protein
MVELNNSDVKKEFDSFLAWRTKKSNRDDWNAEFIG